MDEGQGAEDARPADDRGRLGAPSPGTWAIVPPVGAKAWG